VYRVFQKSVERGCLNVLFAFELNFYPKKVKVFGNAFQEH